MAEIWVEPSVAAREVGYIAGHVQRLAANGKIKARHDGQRRWLVELNSLRQYLKQTQAKLAASGNYKLVAEWLLANKVLWNKSQVELRALAAEALGVDVSRWIIYYAARMARVPRCKSKVEQLEQWIAARPCVLDETAIDAFKIWRDELPVDVARCTFERAFRNVLITLEHDELTEATNE